MKRRGNSGFTVVELVVAIIVIAILAAISIVAYGNIQRQARDSERKSDIVQLKIALDKYYAANSQFPAICAADNSGCSVNGLATPLAPYLSEIPVDPSGSSNQYIYVRGGTGGTSYGIRVGYEAQPACKTGTRVSSGWWGTGVPICS